MTGRHGVRLAGWVGVRLVLMGGWDPVARWPPERHARQLRQDWGRRPEPWAYETGGRDVPFADRWWKAGDREWARAVEASP